MKGVFGEPTASADGMCDSNTRTIGGGAPARVPCKPDPRAKASAPASTAAAPAAAPAAVAQASAPAASASKPAAAAPAPAAATAAGQVTNPTQIAALQNNCDWDGVISLWCGNVLEQVEQLKQRGVKLALPKAQHAFFFKKNTALTFPQFLEALKVGDKRLLPEDLKAFAQELRANGMPVPTAEGRTEQVALLEFFSKNTFRTVKCTAAHTAKYAMSYNNTARTQFGGYFQRNCAPGELILEICIPKAPVKAAELPPKLVQQQPVLPVVAPAGCTALTLHAHIWDGNSLPPELRQQVLDLTARESGFQSASVSRQLGAKFRQAYEAGAIRYAPADPNLKLLMHSQQQNGWQNFGTYGWEGKDLPMVVPQSAFSSWFEAVYEGDLMSPPKASGKPTMRMTVGEMRPPDLAQGECHRHFHAVTRPSAQTAMRSW